MKTGSRPKDTAQPQQYKAGTSVATPGRDVSCAHGPAAVTSDRGDPLRLVARSGNAQYGQLPAETPRTSSRALCRWTSLTLSYLKQKSMLAAGTADVAKRGGGRSTSGVALLMALKITDSSGREELQ